MPLARKIAKTAFDGLNDALKPHYKPNPANADEYFLDADDASGLQSALDAQKATNTALKTQVETIQAALDAIAAEKETIEGEKNKKNKDYDALEKSWKDKLDAAKTASEASEAKLKKQIEKMLVDNKAQELATELFGENAELALPHIKSRLSADFSGEAPVTRVLDKTGTVSASSLEDLSKEFVDNPRFAPIVIASRASGGNAGGGGGTGNAGPGNKKPNELSSQERIDLWKTNPDKFKQLFPEAAAAM